jgi:hypothetical protein
LKINFPDGGYNFAKEVNIKDSSFPFYPIRSKETVYDSTHDAFYTKKLLEAFDESNISLRPEDGPVFRIVFSQWTSPTYFIKIDQNKILIKKGLRVDYLHKDEGRLSELEKMHLEILEFGIPISRRIKESGPLGKRYFDSLVTLYPELLKEEYYSYLMEKAFTPLDKPFTYSTETISISDSKFIEIVEKLKRSGYWTLPFELGCNNSPTDGYQCIVESNCGGKYNIVKFNSCLDEPSAFKIACREIIELMGLSNEVRL